MDSAEKLIGRTRECEELKWSMESHRSELIVMYGRRRVGKTFLVRRFFNDTYSFHYVGAHRQKKNVQLQNFREALMRYGHRQDVPTLENWHDAFLQLEQYLEGCKEKRKVLFFDEMPWMDTQGSDFVAELEYFWANWVQNRDDIVFIACGSATSWMKEKLEDNQGGLHNRITHRIYLRPRAFDPRGQAKLTPEGKIRLTLSGKIKLTPEKQLLFRGFFVVLYTVLTDGLIQNERKS